MNYAPLLFHVALEEVERSFEIRHDRRPLRQQEAIRRRGVRGAFGQNRASGSDSGIVRTSKLLLEHPFRVAGNGLQMTPRGEPGLSVTVPREVVVECTVELMAHAERARRRSNLPPIPYEAGERGGPWGSGGLHSLRAFPGRAPQRLGCGKPSVCLALFFRRGGRHGSTYYLF